METSCGLVLVNYGTVLLLQYPQGHWDLPKGHVEPDDLDCRATAVRELEEETGIMEVVIVDGFKEKTSYSYKLKNKTKTKQVFWFIAKTEELSVKLSNEHRNYMWLNWELAIDLVTHKETKGVLNKAKNFLDNRSIS